MLVAALSTRPSSSRRKLCRDDNDSEARRLRGRAGSSALARRRAAEVLVGRARSSRRGTTPGNSSRTARRVEPGATVIRALDRNGLTSEVCSPTTRIPGDSIQVPGRWCSPARCGNLDERLSRGPAVGWAFAVVEAGA